MAPFNPKSTRCVFGSIVIRLSKEEDVRFGSSSKGGPVQYPVATNFSLETRHSGLDFIGKSS